jgi:hypothetical protein
MAIDIDLVANFSILSVWPSRVLLGNILPSSGWVGTIAQQVGDWIHVSATNGPLAILFHNARKLHSECLAKPRESPLPSDRINTICLVFVVC